MTQVDAYRSKVLDALGDETLTESDIKERVVVTQVLQERHCELCVLVAALLSVPVKAKRAIRTFTQTMKKAQFWISLLG